MVLATQNPVDLDYKAMANAGTWLVGRLQTERDKARVLEGLRSAAGGADIGALDAAIGGLQKRQFLLVSAQATSRAVPDALGDVYLRGPLTKDQVSTLMSRRDSPARPPARARPVVARSLALLRRRHLRRRPRRSDDLPVAATGGRRRRRALPRPGRAWATRSARSRRHRLHAFVAARVSLRFDDRSAGIDEQQEYEALYGPLDGGLDLDCERPSTTTTATSGRSPAGARVRAAGRADRADRRSSATRSATSSGGSSTGGRSSLSQQVAEARLAPGRDPGAVRAALRRGGAGGGRRGGGEDQRSSRRSRQSSRRRSRSPSDGSRSSTRRHRCAPGERARRRRGRGARRAARRQAQRPLDRDADRRRRVETRTSAPAAQRRETAEAKAQQSEDELQRARAGDPRRGAARSTQSGRRQAAEVETVSVGLETGDVHVEKLKLVWVPTS